MTPVAPRMVNEVSYVMMIKQASHFVVREKYFVVQSSTGVVLCSTGVVLCSTK